MNKQTIYFKKLYCPEHTRGLYKSYAPGLVDLFQDTVALDAGLNDKWVQRLVGQLPDTATVDQWRNHFIRMVEEYRREHFAA